MLELKEWIIVIQEQEKEEKINRKMRVLQEGMQYNLKYYEEKKQYLINLNSLRSYYAISY